VQPRSRTATSEARRHLQHDDRAATASAAADRRQRANGSRRRRHRRRHRVDREGRAIASRTALQISASPNPGTIGAYITDSCRTGNVVGNAFATTASAPRRITIMRGGRERTLSIRVTTSAPPPRRGYVITSATSPISSPPRSSAGGYRPAHRRIKNPDAHPASPSASRANSASIGEDREVFDQCRHDHSPGQRLIGRMVDEFSRSPACQNRRSWPAISRCDPPGGVLISVTRPDIEFERDLPKGAHGPA
jgi:hypothetical protein